MSTKDRVGAAAQRFGEALAWLTWILIAVAILGALSWIALAVWRTVL